MHLLIATGGSLHSGVAERLGAQVLAMGPTNQAPMVMTVIKTEVDRPQGEAVLMRAVEVLRPVFPNVQTKICLGDRAEAIVREAREGAYDLIIVGERVPHRLATRFLGSTVTRVIEGAPCPVMIAKGKIRPLRHILLCDSGADSPSLLNHFTRRWMPLLNSDIAITILHVMSQMTAAAGVSGRQLRASAEDLILEHTPEGELLLGDIRLLQGLNLNPVPKVRHGLVVDEILAEARSGDYDLVVIGAYRGQGWQRFLLTNLAHQIIERIDRPLLVVR